MPQMTYPLELQDPGARVFRTDVFGGNYPGSQDLPLERGASVQCGRVMEQVAGSVWFLRLATLRE